MLYQVRLITYDMSLRVKRSGTEWNEAIAADSAITSLRYRCVRNDKYLSRHDISSTLSIFSQCDTPAESLHERLS
ncbi:hypothetical protein [Nostoc sp.]|uniref:hypothetical protein n=1 Tax=Nostoc sp. TaxID=1180 RepID=UPI002FF32D59